MIFIGGGSLLSHAVGYVRKLGIDVALVLCPPQNSAIPMLKKLGVRFVETSSPGRDARLYCDLSDRNKVISINNPYILDSEFLTSGPKFFNIHNGLVQKYRGIAEVCLFAALCKGECEYGATLHKMLPDQKVDSGPIVNQLSFPVSVHERYFEVMGKSIQNCKAIFEENIVDLINDCYSEKEEFLSGSAYSYKDMTKICADADPALLERAKDLGPYKAFFPKLAGMFNQ